MPDKQELPEGWEITLLKNVFVPVKGRKPKRLFKEKQSGSFPYILISSFGIDNHTYYTDDSTCPSCSKEDTLLVWDGARAGLSSIGSEGVIGSTIVALKPKKELIEPKYLYYFVSTLFDEFNSETRGTGIPHLQKEKVYSKKIPLPPLSVQRKIVAKLDAFFKEYNEAKKQHELAKAKSEKIMQAAISKLIPNPEEELPKGWEIKTLDELSLLKQYGYTCAAEKVPNGPRLLRITDMNDAGGFKIEPKVYSNLKSKEARNYLLEKGDLLIARTGEPGKASLFELDELAIFASYLIRFRINPEKALPKFVAFYLQTQDYFDQILEKTTETTQKNVNATKLGQVIIPTPPLHVQRKIVAKLDIIHQKAKGISEEYTRKEHALNLLPNAILRKAFKGELV